MLINAGLEQTNDAQLQEILSVSRWIDGKTGADALIELLYQPTLNIDGIWGGYTEEGRQDDPAAYGDGQGRLATAARARP